MKVPYTCRRCGKVEEMHYATDLGDACFSCWFWFEKVGLKDQPEVVRVNHRHYMIADEDGSRYVRGFGGARFEIEFFDGRKVTSTNLWYQGQIPEDFWLDLPDNARFIHE